MGRRKAFSVHKFPQPSPTQPDKNAHPPIAQPIEDLLFEGAAFRTIARQIQQNQPVSKIWVRSAKNGQFVFSPCPRMSPFVCIRKTAGIACAIQIRRSLG